MQISVEISLYPLKEDYVSTILDFIEKLHEYPNLKVETNGMSTQVFGDYDEVMPALHTEMKEVHEQHQAIFVMKVGKGTLK